MAEHSVKSSYWRGVRDGIPFFFVVSPFGLLFGVLATEAGLPLTEVMAFSIVVIAGAAQFAALQLLQDQAPTIIIILSALAVNLRMAMYSAALTPHLGSLPLGQRIVTAYFLVDTSFASAQLDYEKYPRQTAREKFAYFMGVGTPVCPIWYVVTFIGAMIGETIPDGYGFDFMLPLCFLAMVGPMLRTGAHRIAAIVAVVLALGFAWLPYNAGLLVAALGGMMAGARAEVYAKAPA